MHENKNDAPTSKVAHQGVVIVAPRLDLVNSALSLSSIFP